MTTILKLAEHVNISLAEGAVRCTEQFVESVGQRLWDQERAQGYLPWPEWRWAEHMKRLFPGLRIIEMDKAQESQSGMVY